MVYQGTRRPLTPGEIGRRVFSKTMICVALSDSSPEVLRSRLDEIAPLADLVEVRLDALKGNGHLDIGTLVARAPCPLIATNRSRREGGAYAGAEEDRLAVLKEAVLAGVSYIDIELDTDPTLRDPLVAEARSAGTRVIVSHHDFSGTPSASRLEAIMQAQREAGAHIGKIVTMAHAPEDVHRLFSVYFAPGRRGFPLIAFCMGAAGKMSRLACLALGSHLTYASWESGEETAPGQIPLGQMRSMVEYLSHGGEASWGDSLST